MESLSDGSFTPPVTPPTRKRRLHSPLTVARLPDTIPYCSIVEDHFVPTRAWTDSKGELGCDRPVRQFRNSDIVGGCSHLAC